jgi:hypothetical protein
MTQVWLTVRCGKASVEIDGSQDIENVRSWLKRKNLLKDGNIYFKKIDTLWNWQEPNKN